MKPQTTMGSTGWVCPNCRRRVPRYAAVCHCGARRTDVDALDPSKLWRPQQPRGQGWRDVPVSGWLLLGLSAAVLVTFLVLPFIPIERPPYIPLLGYVDRGPGPHPKR